ncbi:hypothetical protein ACC87_07590, partial [Francisella tularensis subsp. holarctica]
KTHDSKVANLLKNVYNTKVIADRAYHSNEIRQHIQSISSEAVIPCKSNTLNHIPFDSHVYKERHLIENFFSKIKHFRRVFSRFDKTISEYIGMIKLACTFIWLLRNYFCAQNLVTKSKNTVGIRVSEHYVPRAISAEIGEPLVISSFIVPGHQHVVTDCDEVDSQIMNYLDAVVESDYCGYDLTTVVELLELPYQILRQGAGEIDL